MIYTSFRFLNGIDEKTEKNIKIQGIKDWNGFLRTECVRGISRLKKLHYDRQLQRAKKELYRQNSSYFTNFPPSDMWKLYEYFKEEAVFLDIETTGLSRYDQITLIGLFDGIETKTMIRGTNLNIGYLKKELQKYKMIVTFNGSTFDLPFINRKFPDLLPDIPHFDLRHACARIGLRGGLKQIEKQLNIERKNKIVEKLYNGDPVLLWRMYRSTGDGYYLNLLVEYNEEDIINLKPIANHVINELKSKHL